MALVVTGLLEADAYYRCPYDGGAAFVLVELPGGPAEPAESPSARAVTVVTTALSTMPVPITRAAIAAYLRRLDLTVTETADELTIEDGSDTRFEFDELGRLTEITSTRQS